MSLLNVFRAKWKHPDPKVRAAAIASIDDQALLSSLAASDEDETVRFAALTRLTDQQFLAELAKGTSPVALRAAERVTDAKQLASVARHAKAAEVRRHAVVRIDDRHVLQTLATQDTDPEVRRLARARNFARDQLFSFLKEEFSKLEIAEQQAGRVAALCGKLDDVCGALFADQRFRIDGVLAEEAGATVAPAPVAAARRGGRASMELVGGSTPPFAQVETAGAINSYYRIRISRHGQDEFGCSFEEKPLTVAAS